MKRILITALSVLLVAGMAISGTVAYLTDRDGAVNTMTTGNVEIRQYEQDRYGNDFQQNQIILPITGSAQGEKDAKGYPKEDMNYVDKLVTVKNTGNTDAYVRTLIAVPKYTYEGQDPSKADQNVLHWNLYQEKMSPTTNLTYEGKDGYRLDSQRLPGSYSDSDTLVLNNWKLDEASYEISVNCRKYEVCIINHNTKLAAGERTAPNMQGFYLDSNVDYDHDNGVYTYNGKAIDGLTGYVDILVLSQAVQAGGFESATAAFDAALPLGTTYEDKIKTVTEWFSDIVEPGATVGGSDDLSTLRNAISIGTSVLLDSDIDANVVEAQDFTNNVKYTLFEQNGGVFNGNGNTLSANWENGQQVVDGNAKYLNACIVTHGGTIKNVTLDKANRAIFLQRLTEDVILENVKVASNDVGYALNTGNEGNELHKLIAKDSTFGGWISFANLKSASFENCTFMHSNYLPSTGTNDFYGHLVKPYVTTTFTNCNFCADYYLDLSTLGTDCTVTFKNCKVNGVLIADNKVENYFGTVEIPGGGTTTEAINVYRGSIIVNNT